MGNGAGPEADFHILVFIRWKGKRSAIEAPWRPRWGPRKPQTT
jgi:hypothetical protein